MSQLLIYLGLASVILAFAKYFMGRAKTDSIMAQLQTANDQKKKESYLKEAAVLQQEIENAKIDYNRIRDASRSSNTSTDTSGT